MKNLNVIKSAWRRWQKSRYIFAGTFSEVRFYAHKSLLPQRYILAGTFSDIVNGWEHGIEPYRGI